MAFLCFFCWLIHFIMHIWCWSIFIFISFFTNFNFEWPHNTIFNLIFWSKYLPWLKYIYFLLYYAAADWIDHNQLDWKIYSLLANISLARINILNWLEILVSLVILIQQKISLSFTYNTTIFGKLTFWHMPTDKSTAVGHERNVLVHDYCRT